MAKAFNCYENNSYNSSTQPNWYLSRRVISSHDIDYAGCTSTEKDFNHPRHLSVENW